MSGNNDSQGFGTAAFGEAVDAYVKFWTDFASRITAAEFAATPGSTPPEAMREVRSAMLKAMAEASDQYLRSPQFQEAIQQWFAHSIRFRTQMNDWASRLRHEFQGVSRQDIDAVVQAIGRLEARMSDGMERLSERLDALEARGGTAARGGMAPRGGAAARPARGASVHQARRSRAGKVKP